MMRSQNPNPPNDLQEKGHQRAGLPEREVINECYGLSSQVPQPLLLSSQLGNLTRVGQAIEKPK